MQDSPSERDRNAEERERQADERDRLADERDRAADERERLADERDRRADDRERERQRGAAPLKASESDDGPVVVDDDLFGIDLGPSRERTAKVDAGTAPVTATPRSPSRSLSDRLASAAADRGEEDAPEERPPSAED